MNYDQLCGEVGDYLQSLLSNQHFQLVSAWFEQTAVQELLSTKHDDKEGRERIYARIAAHRDFLTTLVQIIARQQELTQPQPQDHSDEDDPSVHNIYR
jgi:hypothetical protein